MTRIEDALAAAQFGADFVGLILAPSPRRVTVAFAKEVARALPAKTRPVLVFRDAPLDVVIAAATATGCGWIQLHGHESAEYVRALALRVPNVHLIKSLDVTAADDEHEAETLRQRIAGLPSAVEVVLLDSPKGGPLPADNRFADIARKLTTRPPAVWRAGGLNPHNVAQVASSGSFDGVDVASGVESRPGLKDHAAMKNFIEAARRS